MLLLPILLQGTVGDSAQAHPGIPGVETVVEHVTHCMAATASEPSDASVFTTHGWSQTSATSTRDGKPIYKIFGKSGDLTIATIALFGPEPRACTIMSPVHSPEGRQSVRAALEARLGAPPVSTTPTETSWETASNRVVLTPMGRDEVPGVSIEVTHRRTR